MRKFVLAVLGLAVGVLSALTPGLALAGESPYADFRCIPEWAREHVDLTTQFRIFQGDADGLFRPASPITRAEFAAIVMRAFSLRPDPERVVPFTDVAGGWYERVIRTAVQTAMIRPEDFGTEFRPSQPITRAEMARMVARAVDARRVVFTPHAVAPFSDVPETHPLAEPIRKAASYGIITGMGDGTFRPDDLATRAQAAVMIARAMRLGRPLDIDVPPTESMSKHKTMKTGPYQVFFAAVELAATRTPGTTVELTPLAPWLSPAARAKLEAILTRDVPARRRSGITDWFGMPPRYVGQDHVLFPGDVYGVDHAGPVSLPLQRQWDGRWVIVDIPFDRIDVNRLDPPAPLSFSFAYTDPTGTYFGHEVLQKNLEQYLTWLGQQPWNGGMFRILRVGGEPWEDSPWRTAVEALHSQVDAQRPSTSHTLLVQAGTGLRLQTYDSGADLAEAVARDSMHMPLLLSIDGVPWFRLSEAPYFRDLLSRTPPAQHLALDQVIRGDRTRYVPAFLRLLEEARQETGAIR